MVRLHYPLMKKPAPVKLLWYNPQFYWHPLYYINNRRSQIYFNGLHPGS